ncbi:MAG: hypothetical protein JSR87_09955 [Proteobacteria bacterium]|nr:hypothetical protein [Pseudomonadota bacterium]MBS0571846.1 hypothetical protein [Pseudomonadota bacterium]
MLIKGALLFLTLMAGLSMLGRYLVTRPKGRFCPHCGRPRPCGCRRGA